MRVVVLRSELSLFLPGDPFSTGIVRVLDRFTLGGEGEGGNPHEIANVFQIRSECFKIEL